MAVQRSGASGPNAPVEEGVILGERYEILKRLGEGGMGAVYKARDHELDRLVALKVIRPELAGHPDILRRFKQELILARQVTHKNVVRIFDLGSADGRKFITMDYIDGRDLKSILGRTRETSSRRSSADLPADLPRAWKRRTPKAWSIAT